jgi:hypothetical protein
MSLVSIELNKEQQDRFVILQKKFNFNNDFLSIINGTKSAIAGGSILWTLTGFKDEKEYKGDIDIFMDLSYTSGFHNWSKKFGLVFENERGGWNKEKTYINHKNNKLKLFDFILTEMGYTTKQTPRTTFENMKEYIQHKKSPIFDLLEYEMKTDTDFVPRIQLIVVANIYQTVNNFDLTFCSCMYHSGKFGVKNIYSNPMIDIEEILYGEPSNGIKSTLDLKKIFFGYVQPGTKITQKVKDRIFKYKKRGFETTFLNNIFYIDSILPEDIFGKEDIKSIEECVEENGILSCPFENVFKIIN